MEKKFLWILLSITAVFYKLIPLNPTDSQNTFLRNWAMKLILWVFLSLVKLTIMGEAGVELQILVTSLISSNGHYLWEQPRPRAVLSNQKVCSEAFNQGHTPLWMYKHFTESLNTKNFTTTVSYWYFRCFLKKFSKIFVKKKKKDPS